MEASARGVVVGGPRRTLPMSPRSLSTFSDWTSASEEKRKRGEGEEAEEEFSQNTKSAREGVEDTPLKPINRGRTMANRVTAALLEKIRTNSSGWELKITGLMRFDCLSKLVEALYDNTSTNRLDLEGAAIGDQGCILIRNLLQKNKMIKTLDLTLNQISDAGCSHLAEVLPDSSLSRLFLSDNIIQDKGVMALAAARPKTMEIFLRGNQRVSPSALALLESGDYLPKADVKMADEGEEETKQTGTNSQLASADEVV